MDRISTCRLVPCPVRGRVKMDILVSRIPYTIITLGLCRSVIILYEKKTRRVSRFADAHGSAISAYIRLNIKGGSRAKFDSAALVEELKDCS